jgi:hypothetical protein
LAAARVHFVNFPRISPVASTFGTHTVRFVNPTPAWPAPLT